MRNITPTQLADRLKETASLPLLLDVREPWEYEICHIENALLIPMGQIHIEIEDLDKSRETVVICHHGLRSRQIAMYLESLGFDDVINLSGGLEAWAQVVDPNMAKY